MAFFLAIKRAKSDRRNNKIAYIDMDYSKKHQPIKFLQDFTWLKIKGIFIHFISLLNFIPDSGVYA